MNANRWIRVMALLAAASMATAVAQQPAAPPPRSLQSVLDRVHQHAANGAWQAPGWRDEAIEGWLEQAVGSIAKAAGDPRFKLPVRMADAKLVERQGATALEGALIVGRNLDLG